MTDLRYELIDDGGNVTEIDAGNIVAGDVTREHTALGTHTVDVKPAPDSLNDLCFDEVRLYYGNDLLFRGYLLKVGRSLKTADTTLEGEGIGRDLKKGATAVIYANTPYYRAIADYWKRFTDFDATVIKPSLDAIQNDANVFDTSDGDSIQDSVTIEETDPLYIDVAGDDLVLAQSCFTREAESLDRGDAFVDSDTTADWSGGSFIFLDFDNDFAEFDFNLDYKIAAEDLGIKFRDLFKEGVNSPDYLDGNLIIKIDGQEVANYNVGPDSGDDIDPRTQVSLAWRDRIQSGINLASGTHTLRIEVTSDRGSPLDDVYRVDVVAPHDTRFDYFFDGDTDANDALAGPELYPDAFSTKLAEIVTTENIGEARVESSLTDTAGSQRWGLRNNPNEPYIYNDNTEDATVDFGAGGADTYGTTLGSEITLSRYDTGSTTTPTEGDAGQRLQDYTLFVTTNDLGVIQGQKAFEGSHLENLQQLHEDAGLRFTIEYEPDSKPVTSYKPGDNTRQKSWITLDSDTGRDVYDYWNHVVAVGRRRPEGRLRAEKPEPDENGDITSDEITRVGEVVTRKRVFSEIVDDEAELEREAASLLAEGVSGDKFDGSIDIMASDVAPGYRYESLDAFGGRNVDLESVDYTIAAGDATGSLTFGGAQKTTETTSQIVESKRDEKDTRRSIGDGLNGQVIQNPIGDIEIDLFDDADFSEYSDPDGILSQETNFVVQGDSAARVAVSGDGTAQAVSDSGLPNYPSRGDEFVAKIATEYGREGESNNGTSVAWGDSNGFYGITVFSGSPGNNTIILGKAGSETPDTLSFGDYYTESYLNFVVRYDVNGNGDIEADAYLNGDKLGTLSINDTDYGSGRFGVAAENRGGYVDSVRLII
jgi:hypothetical protein